MGKAKLIGWGLAAVLLAFTTGLGTGWWKGNEHGRMGCEQRVQEAVDAHVKKQRGLADELDKTKRERDALVQRGVRTVYLEADPTGCADTDALPGVLDALRAGAGGSAPGK